MPRNADSTEHAIRRTAVRLFAEHGFAATTVRGLASEVGIQVGSVYNHISSKEGLLFLIMSDVMRDLIETTQLALARRSDPAGQLRAAVEVHIEFHAQRAEEAFIGNSELRSLSSARRAAVVERRDAYERMIRQIIENGVDSGVFHVDDPPLVTYAIIALGSHVAAWYSAGGRLSIDEVAAVYADFILRAVTASPTSTVLDSGPDAKDVAGDVAA